VFYYTHWANIGVLCNVTSHILIFLGQRHAEKQSITGLLTNVAVSVNKTNQEGEDYKSTTMRNGLNSAVYHTTVDLLQGYVNFKCGKYVN
jgi:hypothetical protein